MLFVVKVRFKEMRGLGILGLVSRGHRTLTKLATNTIEPTIPHLYTIREQQHCATFPNKALRANPEEGPEECT